MPGATTNRLPLPLYALLSFLLLPRFTASQAAGGVIRSLITEFSQVSYILVSPSSSSFFVILNTHIILCFEAHLRVTSTNSFVWLSITRQNVCRESHHRSVRSAYLSHSLFYLWQAPHGRPGPHRLR